ncbi:MFS transporter [Peribacillus simplex]|uniref:MFS transporter n=1 Tax=Peribacillus simplex TaxID=1478 RepID=UPI00366C5064
MREVNASEVVGNSRFGRFHLLVFMWCLFAITFDGFDIAMYGVGLPLMMEEWNLTPVEAGGIASYSLFGMMVGALIFAPLADKLGRKKVLAICICLFSVFTLLSSFAPNPAFFSVMRFIAALGMGGLMPNVISLMAEYSPKKNKVLIVTTMYCGYSIGSILASLIGMYVMEQMSWRVLYWIGALPLLALPFFLKQFPESLSYYVIRKQGAKLAGILNRIDPDGDYKESDDYEFAKVQERAKGFPVKKLFENKRTLSTFAFWVAAFNCLLMVYGLNTWLPKIMQQSGYGLSSSLSFNLISGIGQIGGSIIGGYLVGKIGHRRVLVSLCAIGTVCFVILGLTPNVLALYILIAFGGACTVGTMNLANTYISEYYPREIRTTGIGWALAFGRIGAIVAPTLIGLLLAANYSPQNAFMAFTVPSIMAALALLVVKERYGSYDKPQIEENIKLKATSNV